IRMSGIQAALCFTAPAVLAGIFRVRKDYKYLLVFLIPLVITIPSDHFYRKSLETEADIRFREWNTLRAQFHGFPVERINRDNEKIRSVNNWSQNDYDLLSWWSYFDENKFNMDTLKNVFKYSLPLPTISEKVAFPLIKRDFIKLLKIHHIYLCVLVFIALLGFVTRGKRGSVMPVIYLGYVLGGVMWMLIFFRFPPRIGIPILLSCITWMTYIVFDNKKIRPESNNGGKKLTIFSGLLFMLFACAGIYCFWNFLKENSVKKEAYYRSVKELEEMKASFFLIEPRRGLNCQLADPLKSHNYNFKIIPSGWPIYSPRFYRVLREIGMEHAYEICPRLTSDEGCFVVGDELYVTRISKYLSQSYGLHHRLITVKQLSNHKTVYKLEAM
ncbi:MAG: hypothetical protein ACYSTR_09095, partial [Planctomycetota bacterium]